MTLQEFASVAQGIQGVLAGLALLIAAACAVWSFKALGQIPRARAEIQMLEKEAKTAAVIEISIKTSQYCRANDDYTYVLAIVDVENKGNRHTTLDYNESRKPFSVYPVDCNDDGSLKFGDPISYPVPQGKNPNRPLSRMLVRAGGRETMPFYFRVSSPGVYLLVFRTQVPEAEELRKPGQDLQEQASGEQGPEEAQGLEGPSAWTAKEYLVVERPNQDQSS